MRLLIGLERGGNEEPCAVLILDERDAETAEAMAKRVVDGANQTAR